MNCEKSEKTGKTGNVDPIVHPGGESPQGCDW